MKGSGREDGTARAASSTMGLYTCPKCSLTDQEARFTANSYICPTCGQELIYTDVYPYGRVQIIYGWLLQRGTMVRGRYRVAKLLGRGGFGATYLAEDAQMNNRKRALKEIPTAHYDEEEVRILSALSHPAIPDVVDSFEVGPMTYVLMEFAGEESVQGRLEAQQGPLPEPKVIEWSHQLCEVLGYLHSQDPPIVHRDLRPSNLLLTTGDKVMLIDYGIAKAQPRGQRTRPAARFASPGFSPLEQYGEAGTDPRSDIYALGATLYHLLTGAVPTEAPMRAVSCSLLPPRSLNPRLSASTEAVILKALELNPSHRFQSADEMKIALLRAAAHLGHEPGPQALAMWFRKGSAATSIPASQEIIDRLNELLEAEWAGVEVAVKLASAEWQSYTPEDLRKFSEDEGWACSELRRAIVRHGGIPSPKMGGFAEKVLTLENEGERLELLIRGQMWVVKRIDQLLAMDLDPQTRAFLEEMREQHLENAHRCHSTSVS